MVKTELHMTWPQNFELKSFMDEHGVKRGKPLSDVRLSSLTTVLPILI